MTRNDAHQSYKLLGDAAKTPAEKIAVARKLCLDDLFFLLIYGLHRVDADRDWIYAQVREVEAAPDSMLDLWAREHYKSTIITFAKTIQDILRDPEITVGIFSHTRPIAKGFLRQIKREFESNKALHKLFPDILWSQPHKESPKWSEDDGIIIKRKGNPKEATVEAWGLVDGQPTSKHFQLRVYDDVVTKESVSSPEMIKKVNESWELSLNLGADGGRVRYVGTRYHYNDTYRLIIDRGAATPRIKPATDDGTVKGKSVLLHPDTLIDKRRDMGPYTFGCLGANTQILMADWSVKSIHAVHEGDDVVGWTMNPREKSKLVPTRVISTQHHRDETVQIIMSGGQNIICTPDHKWWTGRRTEDRGREVYRPAGTAYNELSSLCKVLDLTQNRWPVGPNIKEAAAYIAGIFDGEGTVSGGCIHISQCERTHPKVCDRIRSSLSLLGFEFSEHRPKGREHQIDFYIKGGRQEKFRFLMLCDPAKRDQVSRSMFLARDFGKDSRESIASIAPAERQMVYNIQTETGNYIANGYCSKNCQMLLDPKADEVQGFRQEWLKFWPANHFTGLNKIILCDPANEKKKSNDYTVFLVLGLGPDQNYYLIDMVRDRLSLTERATILFKLHREFRPQFVGYEKYGKDSDIQHYESLMERDNYRFGITPLGGKLSKEDRIRTLIPLFEQGRIFIPDRLLRTNYERVTEDLIQAFIKEEYLSFPVAPHDDMLDCLARITDPDCYSLFPDQETATRPTFQDTMADIFTLSRNVQRQDYDVFGGR